MRRVRRKAVEDYLIDQLVYDPAGVEHIPHKYRTIVNGSAFIRRLLAAKHSLLGKNDKDGFIDQFLEGLLPSKFFSGECDDRSCMDWRVARNSCVAWLRAKWNTREHLIRHLNKVGAVPATLFPEIYPDDGFEDIAPDQNEGVYQALNYDPLFLSWLGKNGNGYSSDEIDQLTHHAIASATYEIHIDPRFHKAIGLNSLEEYTTMRKLQRQDVCFREARQMALSTHARDRSTTASE